MLTSTRRHEYYIRCTAQCFIANLPIAENVALKGARAPAHRNMVVKATFSCFRLLQYGAFWVRSRRSSGLVCQVHVLLRRAVRVFPWQVKVFRVLASLWYTIQVLQMRQYLKHSVTKARRLTNNDTTCQLVTAHNWVSSFNNAFLDQPCIAMHDWSFRVADVCAQLCTSALSRVSYGSHRWAH